MIHIGEIKHKSIGHITLEISNEDEFIRRVKEINKRLPGNKAEKMKLWKIRVVGGTEKARIRHLIEGTEKEPEAVSAETQEVNPESPPSNLGAASPPEAEAPKPTRPTRRLARRVR